MRAGAQPDTKPVSIEGQVRDKAKRFLPLQRGFVVPGGATLPPWALVWLAPHGDRCDHSDGPRSQSRSVAVRASVCCRPLGERTVRLSTECAGTFGSEA